MPADPSGYSTPFRPVSDKSERGLGDLLFYQSECLYERCRMFLRGHPPQEYDAGSGLFTFLPGERLHAFQVYTKPYDADFFGRCSFQYQQSANMVGCDHEGIGVPKYFVERRTVRRVIQVTRHVGPVKMNSERDT
jgi:hypothetical protein